MLQEPHDRSPLASGGPSAMHAGAGRARIETLSPDEVTRVVESARAGDLEARARLSELAYAELRAIAGSALRHERASHTLQPTALVHEAFVRLLDRPNLTFNDRAHFLAVCAVTMRSILVDHARRRGALKRGGGRERVTLSDAAARADVDPIDALALEEALERLQRRSARQARVVECRMFGGMTIAETAVAIDVSTTTVEDDWRMARAWLSSQLAGGECA